MLERNKEVSDSSRKQYKNNEYTRSTGVKKGAESLFKQIINKQIPNLWKEPGPRIQEANKRTPYYLIQKGLFQGTLY